MVLLEYPAGASSPAHYHPIAGPNYVIQGTLNSQWADSEAVETFSAGDSFIDYADKMHIKVQNASQTMDLKFVACYVVRIGEPNVVMAGDGTAKG